MVFPSKTQDKILGNLGSKGVKIGQSDLIILRDEISSLEFRSENTYFSENEIEIKSNLDRAKIKEVTK